jgi:uncharacterized LabA/DUF88 family protein
VGIGKQSKASFRKEVRLVKRRLALFFDGANHSEALKRAKVSLNYEKFLENLNLTYDVVSARYYSGISDDPQYKNVRDFLGSLSKKGYVLITKPVHKYPDESVKANMDIEIAVDMVTMSPRLDKVMLFSGDGDFTYAVDTIQRIGVSVTVVSHKPYASVELRNQSNEFYELAKLAEDYNY